MLNPVRVLIEIKQNPGLKPGAIDVQPLRGCLKNLYKNQINLYLSSPELEFRRKNEISWKRFLPQNYLIGFPVIRKMISP